MVYILRFCIWNITEIKQQKTPLLGGGECEMVMLRGWVEDNISVLGRASWKNDVE